MVKIYCDMDGVLCDFNRSYYDLTGIDITGTYNDNPKFWDPIHKSGIKFWSEMRWTSDGKKLWNYIKKYNPIILSAPSEKIESRIGKILWIRKELPDTDLILRESYKKKEFANPNAVLIDDMEKNIDSWIECGGVGILHTTTDNTIKKLKKIRL